MSGEIHTSNISQISYVYSTISISLVLFLLGLVGAFLIYAQALSEHFKENVEVMLMISDDAQNDALDNLKNELDATLFVKSLEYVSKEEAARLFMEQQNENFMDILEENPLFSSINVHLKAAYANNDSLAKIKKQLLRHPLVSDVFYQHRLVDVMNAGIGKISIALLILSAIFLIIAYMLIDNTIRLSMYSNRFLIKSMQLVGATRMFISKPFISKSIYNGALSGLVAIFLLTAILVFANKSIPELALLNDPFVYLMLCAFIVMAGIFISWHSTRSSVVKYLQRPPDELY